MIKKLGEMTLSEILSICNNSTDKCWDGCVFDFICSNVGIGFDLSELGEFKEEKIEIKNAKV